MPRLDTVKTGQQRPIDAKKVVMSVIRRHRVLVFFLLAIALSWGAIPWQSFFAPGVLVAALVVVGVTEGVAGLKAMGRRLIRWRVSWVWYALAIAVPLSVKFASIGLNTALGAPVPDLGALNLWYSIPMAIAINIVHPLNAQLPEESSFRGWAQPTLQLDADTARGHRPDGHRGHRLAPPALRDGSVRVEPDRGAGYRLRHVLVRLAVQPCVGQLTADLDRPRHRRNHRDQHAVAGCSGHRVADVAVLRGLVCRRPGPAGVRPEVLDLATCSGRRSVRHRSTVGTGVRRGEPGQEDSPADRQRPRLVINCR